MKCTKNKDKKYDCFISHASEDKSDFVEALVQALENKGIKVWYDAHAMNIGDSLRESIDLGLKESVCGIVVLSKNFFAKHWTDYELNGLVARQNSNGQKIILPIWHNITVDEVREYSPSLSDIVAGDSKAGIETITRSIIKSINNIKSNSSEINYITSDIGKESAQIIENYEQNIELISSNQAKSTIEDLIVDKKNIIKINKFYNSQLSELLNLLTEDFNEIAKLQPDNHLLYERTNVYDRYCEKLLNTVICGAYWGDNSFDKLWFNIFKNLANCKIMEQGYTSLIKFQRYPSLLLYYALLLVSIIKEDFELIYLIFYGFDADENNNERTNPISVYYPEYIIQKQVFNSILQKNFYTPVNDHIHDVLRPYFTEYISNDREYSMLFDKVEYLISLEFAFNNINSNFGIWFPIGRYAWRNDFFRDVKYINKNHPFHYFNKLVEKGEIFNYGLLGKSSQKYNEVLENFVKRLAEIHFL